MHKADLILHPIRMRMLLQFAAGTTGRRLTAQQLSERLRDVPQATLYRHLKLLSESGVLAVVEERQVRGTIERTYALPEGGAIVSGTDIEDLSREDHLRYFATFAASLIGDFGRYLERDAIDLVKDGVGYRQVALNLSDEEFQQFVKDLQQVVLPLLDNEPAAERTRRILTTVIIPFDED